MEKDKTSTKYLNAIKTFLPVKIYGLMKEGRPLQQQLEQDFPARTNWNICGKEKKKGEQPVERE